jgi:prevent-host-death family protein
MNRVVSVSEAKAQLSRLLRAVETGEDIVIARRGVPVARLIPVQRHQPGEWAGLFDVSEDALDALAESMSEAEIAALERIDPQLGI